MFDLFDIVYLLLAFFLVPVFVFVCVRMATAGYYSAKHFYTDRTKREFDSTISKFRELRAKAEKGDKNGH